MARPSIRDLNLEPAPVPFPSRASLPALTEKPLELQAEGWGQAVAALKMRAEEAEVRAEHLKRQLDAANDRNDLLEDRLGKETAKADRFQRKCITLWAKLTAAGTIIQDVLREPADEAPPVDEQKISTDHLAKLEAEILGIVESDDVA